MKRLVALMLSAVSLGAVAQASYNQTWQPNREFSVISIDSKDSSAEHLMGANQTLVELLSETIHLDGQGRNFGLTKGGRSLSQIRLPEGTIKYYVRFVTSSTQPRVGESLLSLLGSVPLGGFSPLSAAKFAVNTSSSRAVNVHIFTSWSHADAFQSFLVGYDLTRLWVPCQSLTNRVSSCIESTCLNDYVWIGLGNPNLVKGVEVSLEVVALVQN